MIKGVAALSRRIEIDPKLLLQWLLTDVIIQGRGPKCAVLHAREPTTAVTDHVVRHGMRRDTLQHVRFTRALARGASPHRLP